MDSRPLAHSHSMVPGGLLVTPRTTRLISSTALVIRGEMRASIFTGQANPVSGHGILEGNRAQHDRVAVGAPVDLHPHRAHIGGRLG